MGQYYLTVNLDKRECIHPHKFGDGLKLLEFGDSAGGTMTALAILLADGNNRGGGDLHSDNPIIGSWAGDRIVVAGDYADDLKFLKEVPIAERRAIQRELEYDEHKIDGKINLYTYAGVRYTDISEKVIEAMREDSYLANNLKRRLDR